MKCAFEHVENLYLSVINNKSAIQSCFEDEVLSPLSVDVQDKILDVTLRNPITLRYPPPKSFRKLFLRTLLNRVEELGSECSDDLAKAYTDALSESTEERKSYKSYKLNKSITVTLEEDPCFVTRSTTGLQTWEAAKYLSEWCLENATSLQNKTILELGSGVGLLGIVVSECCSPRKYIFSDKSWEVLKMLSTNLDINTQGLKDVEIDKQHLVWSAVKKEDADRLSPDIILGADITFDRDALESLVSALKTFLRNGNTSSVYIASTIRNPETKEAFTKLLDSAGLVYTILRKQRQSIFIYNAPSTFILYKIEV